MRRPVSLTRGAVKVAAAVGAMLLAVLDSGYATTLAVGGVRDE